LRNESPRVSSLSMSTESLAVLVVSAVKMVCSWGPTLELHLDSNSIGSTVIELSLKMKAMEITTKI